MKIWIGNILYYFFIAGKPCALYDITNPDWAPTLKLGHRKVDPAATTRDSSRHQRAVERKDRKKNVNAAKALLELQCGPRQEANVDVNDMEDIDSGTGTQTNLSSSTVEAMQEELQRLITENRELKEKLAVEQNKFDQNFFREDDEKVRYYTGLQDYCTLDILFQFVEPYIPHSSASVLSKFQQLVLTLIKLRLNLSHLDNGHRFGINRSSASRLFLSMVDVLYKRLKPLIYWPDRNELRETTPMSFRVHFGTKVAVIVDCFEIFLERPSNLVARTSTWSSYKHNNTVKFLIGIAPQGTISFISQGWGGRTSDKHVMEHCGILNKLNPGDTVLADRGFDIADSVGIMGAELKIPTFTKGKKQLSGEDVEKTRRIANVRIHVERVIGSLRQKYTILQGTLPIDYVYVSDTKATTLDKICLVCCALTNMCPSVVPFQ